MTEQEISAKDVRLKKIVFDAGFNGINTPSIRRLMALKNWHHIYNSGAEMRKAAEDKKAMTA